MKEKKCFSVLLAAFAAGNLLFAADPAPAAPVAPAPAPAAPVAAEAAKPVDPWSVLPDKLAEYDGKILTKQELKEQFLAQFPNHQLPPMVTAEKIKEAAPVMVKMCIQRKVLLAEMMKAGYKPSAERAKKMLREELKSVPKEQVAVMEQQLQAQGKTLESYLDEIAQQPTMQEQLAAQQFLQETLFKDVKVTEADARKFYDEHPANFVVPADSADALRASHILVMVKPDAPEAEKKVAKEKIDAILKEVQANPASFEEKAKTLSDCPSGARSNGSLGSFQKGTMVPEFEKALLGLKDGEISGVVTTQFGYHIIRRDPLQKQSVTPFAEVKGELMENLETGKKQELIRDYMQKLENAAKVKLLI